jgi:hypothetical protein
MSLIMKKIREKKDLLLSMAVKRKGEVFLVQVAGSVSGSAMYLPSACT